MSLQLVSLFVGGIALFTILYFIVIAVSPELVMPSPSEKRYLSAQSPQHPLPLPSIEDPPSVDLSVVIPAYNESERLPQMLELTLAHLRSTREKHTFEVLIVDDGSKDSTFKLAITLAQANTDADIRVAKLDRNLGKGGAVRHGCLHTRGRRLLMVDADGASRFEDIEALWNQLDKVESGGRGIAIGSRAHMVSTDAVVKRSAIRNILMYGFHFVVGVLGVSNIRDTQCGFKLFTRDAARELFPRQHLNNWVFDVELLIMAQRLSIPVVEVPITWHEVPGSKLSLVTASLGMLTDLVILRMNYALGRWSTSGYRPKFD